jgi:hypothetical protein
MRATTSSKLVSLRHSSTLKRRFGKARITPMYFASSFGRTLIGCAIVGENTTAVLDRSLVPVRGRDN